MKKYKYISVAALLLAGMNLSSCSDFLDADNKSNIEAEGYFSSNPSALLNSTYNNLKSIVFNPGLFSQGTDLYRNTRGKDPGVYNQYSLTPGETTVANFYSNLYKTINYANGVVKYAGETSSQAYEARFVRNYAYYILTQQFGSVPYTTSYINSPETNYPRVALSEIYTSMINDLTDLYNNSSLESQNKVGKASKQAVAALLSKVYLAAAWDQDVTTTDMTNGTYSVNSTSNFEQAAQWAEKAIDGTQLTMPFADKWSPNFENTSDAIKNAEEIWSIQYDRSNYPGDATEAGHSMQNNFGGYYGNCVTTGQKNVGSENAQSEKSMYLFEEGDSRYEGTFMTTLYNSTYTNSTKAASNWGSEGYYAYYNVADLSKTRIAHLYFPYYVGEGQVEKYLAEHKDQLSVDPENTVTQEVTADILTAPSVTRYTFNVDGSIKNKTTIDMTSYNVITSNGVCVKKFDDPASAQLTDKNDYRDIIIFHVSDEYLVAAEAYLMANQKDKALEKLNAVRNRAGLENLNSFSEYRPEYTTSNGFEIRDIDVILDERARELYAEGQRWMDLRRTKQLVRYNVEFNEAVTSAKQMMNAAGTEYKLYRPIPSNEISANTAITSADQNPGY